VEDCVDVEGKVVSAAIFRSSGHADVDEAALKIARANKYSHGKDSLKNTLESSCIRFKVKFVLTDEEPAAADG
jgi:TonB family protein